MDHLAVITGCKWDYTFYKWGDLLVLITDKWPEVYGKNGPFLAFGWSSTAPSRCRTISMTLGSELSIDEVLQLLRCGGVEKKASLYEND